MSKDEKTNEKIIKYNTKTSIPSCWEPNKLFFKEWQMLLKDGKAIALIKVKVKKKNGKN